MNEFDHRRFSAVAFDFDGVLADTHAVHEVARLQAFKWLSEMTGDDRYVSVPREVHAEAHHHGSSPETIIGWILRQSGIDTSSNEGHDVLRSVVDKKIMLYRDFVTRPGLPALEHARSLVVKLAMARRNTLGIVTTAHEYEVLPFLGRHGLTSYFPSDRLVTRERVDFLKPDPEAYEVAIEALNAGRPGMLLAVEDSPHGIEAAKQAGARVIGVATTRAIEDLAPAAPDAIAKDLSEVHELLGLKPPAKPIH